MTGAGAAAPAVTLDTSAPWLAPYQSVLLPAQAARQAGAEVAEALNLVALHQGGHAAPVLAGGALRFAPQAALPAGEAYEAFIHRTALVPTRNNLHDFFNGLVWLAQPALKRRLNQLQADEIARRGVAAQRGPVRDALTLFDESGALLQAPPPLVAALRQRDWTALFITHRAQWAQARLTLIGHALLEKLATAPRKALTAATLVVHNDASEPLALGADAWAGKPFLPLPVLGVPGWWAANGDPAFYQDDAVFRPAVRSDAPIKGAPTPRSLG